MPGRILVAGKSEDNVLEMLRLANPKAEIIKTKSLESITQEYDLIYFEEIEITDFLENLIQKTNNTSIFIFNAIHSTRKKEQVWEDLKSNQKITVTIDTFWLGFVFFRKEQAKEHFILRV